VISSPAGKILSVEEWRVEIDVVRIRLMKGPANPRGGALMEERLFRVRDKNKLEKVQPARRKIERCSDGRDREVLYYELTPGQYIVVKRIWHNSRKGRSYSVAITILHITQRGIYTEESSQGSFPLDHL
jgi:hypothetical protein